MDSYFLNISDGEPYFGNSDLYYSGDVAFDHTRKMVKEIEGMGIKTLSYFVDQWVQEMVMNLLMVSKECMVRVLN